MFAVLFFIATFISSVVLRVEAHMSVQTPAVFRSATNPNVGYEKIDYDLRSPLSPDGSNFPCKGYLDDMWGPEGSPTATVNAGDNLAFTLDGSAVHDGGSCQASLSFDEGQTWKVVKSWIGDCVRHDGSQYFEFPIPGDARSGNVAWSWSWFNRVGNREMYQNCGIITIENGGDSTLDEYPDIFLAHIGNGVNIPEGFDVSFPDPGSVVEYSDYANPCVPGDTCVDNGWGWDGEDPSSSSNKHDVVVRLTGALVAGALFYLA